MFKRIIGLVLCFVIVMMAATVCVSESADVGEVIEEYTDIAGMSYNGRVVFHSVHLVGNTAERGYSHHEG